MSKPLTLYGLCVATVLVINVAPTVFVVLAGQFDPTLGGRWVNALVEFYVPYPLFSLLFEVVRKRMPPWKFMWRSILFWAVSFPFITVIRYLIMVREVFWEYMAYLFPHAGVALVFFPVQAAFGAGYGFLFYMVYGIIGTLLTRRAMKKLGKQPGAPGF